MKKFALGDVVNSDKGRRGVVRAKPPLPALQGLFGRPTVINNVITLATVPIGYGDGVRRALTNNADVLIHARRYPLVGTVSMDNVTIDVGRDGAVRVGDEVVLIGEGLPAEEMARRLDTINYEITCAIAARVPREHVGG